MIIPEGVSLDAILLETPRTPMQYRIEGFKGDHQFWATIKPRGLKFLAGQNKNFSLELLLLLFDDNKIKMSRKPGKKQKLNSTGCIGKVKYEMEI